MEESRRGEEDHREKTIGLDKTTEKILYKNFKTENFCKSPKKIPEKNFYKILSKDQKNNRDDFKDDLTPTSRPAQSRQRRGGEGECE